MKGLKRVLALLMAMAMLLTMGGVAEEPGETEQERLLAENANVSSDVLTDESSPAENEADLESATLTLDQFAAVLDYSQSVVLRVVVPEGAESVTWKSSDEGVARLNSNGDESIEVVGINEGSATITCTSGSATEL